MNASHCRTLHICFLSLNSHAMHCFQNTAHFYYINTSTLLSEYAISLILIFGSVFVRLLQLHMCKCWAVRETLVMIMLSRSCIDSCQLKSSAVDRCKTCAWPPYIKYRNQRTPFLKDQSYLQYNCKEKSFISHQQKYLYVSDTSGYIVTIILCNDDISYYVLSSHWWRIRKIHLCPKMDTCIEDTLTWL